MRKAPIIFILISFLFPWLSFASTYGSNLFTNSPSAFADLSNSNVPSNAIDGNLATFWTPGTSVAPPHWWEYQFATGTTAIIAQLKITPYWDGTYGQGLKNFSIYGSNDHLTWLLVNATTTAIDNGADQITQTYQFANNNAYQYYRINFADSYRTGANNQIVIEEIQGMECTDCSSTSTASSSIIGFMSPQLDFLLQLLVEAIFVIMGLIAGYLIIKKLEKK